MGVHCETTATGVLLNHIGVHLSEPMLFGLGSGLGFVYWDTKNTPFLGGRSKPFTLTRNVVDRLGLTLRVDETTSTRKAWQNIEGRAPVGLQLDSYHLEYFTSKVHFGGHFVAFRGHDGEIAHLVDTDQQGGEVTTSLASLERARAERGPMTARNLSYTISGTISGTAKLTGDAVREAIHRTAHEFLNPPISNLGHRGIRKAAAKLRTWEERGVDLQLVSTLMERGGTGGALFRNLYRDFLAECGIDAGYAEIAPLWTEVARLIARGDLSEAAATMLDLADRETAAMKQLITLSPFTINSR
jgi:hypothetical protein